MFCSMLFCYNIHKMLKELNSYLYQFAYGKISFIIHHFAYRTFKPGLKRINRSLPTE